MLIAVDLDDVLGDSNTALLSWHNKKYGTTLEKKDCGAYDLSKIWGGTRQETAEKLYAYVREGHVDSVAPIDGAWEVLQELKEEHELFVMTARPQDIAQQTRGWIDKHFPGIFSDIFFSDHNVLETSLHKKTELCRILGIDILIDDSLEFALDCHAVVSDVLLFDQEYPWNTAHSLPENVTRVKTWREVKEFIHAMRQ